MGGALTIYCPSKGSAHAADWKPCTAPHGRSPYFKIAVGGMGGALTISLQVKPCTEQLRARLPYDDTCCG